MRRRIVTLTVGLTTAVILAFAIPLAFLIFQSVESKALDRARYQAEAVAAYLSAVSPTQAEVTQFLNREREHEHGTTWVESPQHVILGTPPAGWTDDDVSGGDNDADNDGRPGDVAVVGVDDVGGGAVTRAVAYTVDGPWIVRTYLTDHQLHEGLWSQWAVLAGVTLGLLAASVGAGELVARRLAGPLEEMARTAQRLAAGDTSARAPTTGPREVAEVGSALNDLGDRIDQVIAAEREAVADLSHRLRTPLTALRLDVDALDDPEDAERLGGHVTALERTLTAIIHAARRPSREGRIPSSDAVDVVQRRVDFWRPLVVEQDRGVDLRLPPGPLSTRVSADDLASAVDALIENVIAHTPEGSDFAVSVRPDMSDSRPMVVVTVADQGPGLSPGAGIRGRSDRGSTGLGLDIARRCAEASGGEMRLLNEEPSGARIELWLGTRSRVRPSQVAHRSS